MNKKEAFDKLVEIASGCKILGINVTESSVAPALTICGQRLDLDVLAAKDPEQLFENSINRWYTSNKLVVLFPSGKAIIITMSNMTFGQAGCVPKYDFQPEELEELRQVVEYIGNQKEVLG